LGWRSPKVSGLVCEYSRFAETIGGYRFDRDCRLRLASVSALIPQGKELIIDAAIVQFLLDRNDSDDAFRGNHAEFFEALIYRIPIKVIDDDI